MKVKFKRGWFAPDGAFFQVNGNEGGVFEVSETLLDFLPGDAVVLEGPKNPNTLEDQSAAIQAGKKRAGELVGDGPVVADAPLLDLTDKKVTTDTATKK